LRRTGPSTPWSFSWTLRCNWYAGELATTNGLSARALCAGLLRRPDWVCGKLFGRAACVPAHCNGPRLWCWLCWRKVPQAVDAGHCTFSTLFHWMTNTTNARPQFSSCSFAWFMFCLFLALLFGGVLPWDANSLQIGFGGYITQFFVSNDLASSSASYGNIVIYSLACFLSVRVPLFAEETKCGATASLWAPLSALSSRHSTAGKTMICVCLNVAFFFFLWLDRVCSSSGGQRRDRLLGDGRLVRQCYNTLNRSKQGNALIVFPFPPLLIIVN